jgi:hypothetical protein
VPIVKRQSLLRQNKAAQDGDKTSREWEVWYQIQHGLQHFMRWFREIGQTIWWLLNERGTNDMHGPLLMPVCSTSRTYFHITCNNSDLTQITCDGEERFSQNITIRQQCFRSYNNTGNNTETMKANLGLSYDLLLGYCQVSQVLFQAAIGIGHYEKMHECSRHRNCTPAELENTIALTIEVIRRATLLDDVASWRRRSETCVETDWDYFEEKFSKSAARFAL